MSSENPFEILGKTFEEGKEIDKKINASLVKAEGAENLASNKESLEKLEERERVIALLHDFYQERQKNMAVHREIAELAEKMRELFSKASPLIDKFYGSESEVGEEYTSRANSLKIGRTEIVQKWKQKNGTDNILEIIEQLENILREKVFEKKPTKEEEKQLSELIENLKETDDKINEKVRKLWDIRENIAKELILTVPEFADFKDAELSKELKDEGLYNLDSEIWMTKIFETEKGKEEENIYFELDDFRLRNALKNLDQKFNITEQELKEIKDLEWSAEEKEKLKNLMEDVGEYRAEAVKLKEGLLKSANFKFKNEGADLIKDEFIRAFIRQLYEDYKLPIIHKERVVQEIMNGTFSF